MKQRGEGAEKRGSRVVLPAGLRLRAVHRPNTGARQVKLTPAGMRIRLDAAVQSRAGRRIPVVHHVDLGRLRMRRPIFFRGWTRGPYGMAKQQVFCVAIRQECEVCRMSLGVNSLGLHVSYVGVGKQKVFCRNISTVSLITREI